MKYRVLEKNGWFYPQYFDYEQGKWEKYYEYGVQRSIPILFRRLEDAYEFLRDQIPTQFIHPFPEQ